MTPSDDRDEYRNECNHQGRESTCPGEDHSRYETALRRFGLLWHQWMLIVFSRVWRDTTFNLEGCALASFAWVVGGSAGADPGSSRVLSSCLVWVSMSVTIIRWIGSAVRGSSRRHSVRRSMHG